MLELCGSRSSKLLIFLTTPKKKFFVHKNTTQAFQPKQSDFDPLQNSQIISIKHSNQQYIYLDSGFDCIQIMGKSSKIISFGYPSFVQCT